MSFSSDAKAELCRAKLDRKSCAVAESYGVLLYSNTFSPLEIRIITASPDFCARLPRLFKRAFGTEFDRLPPEDAEGKRTFLITGPEKIRKIYETFGQDADATAVHHINFGVLEEDADRLAFVRGAFLAGGSVTDPEKRYHLELATRHRSVSPELRSILLDMGFSPKEASRGSTSLLYYKKATEIADFLTKLGASAAALSIHSAKLDKEVSGNISRAVNCTFANADRTVSAAAAQIAAIKAVVHEYGLDALPEDLRDVALLRITNPEASLGQLSQLSYPHLTKSSITHRINKLMRFKPPETDFPELE